LSYKASYVNYAPRGINLDPLKDDYRVGLLATAARVQQLAVRCLGFQPRRDGGQPACVVGDVAEGDEARGPDTALPSCRPACCAAWASVALPIPADPDIVAACRAEPADCYCAEPSSQPGVCPGGVVAGLWRAGPAPQGRLLSFTCAVP